MVSVGYKWHVALFQNPLLDTLMVDTQQVERTQGV
jgi:hypothetical protein